MRNLALILVLTGIVAHAQAACGGGGWKKPTVVTQIPAATTTTAPTVSAPAAKAPEVQTVPAAFVNASEVNVTQLKLTQAQRDRVEKIQNDVQQEFDQLKNQVAQARIQVEQCHGDCGPELARKRDLEKKLATFEVTREVKERIYTELGICDIPAGKATASR